jgi:hypothetical protein
VKINKYLTSIISCAVTNFLHPILSAQPKTISARASKLRSENACSKSSLEILSGAIDDNKTA